MRAAIEAPGARNAALIGLALGTLALSRGWLAPATLLLALLVPLLLAPPASADAPDEETWQADVAGVMAGANAWLEELARGVPE